MPKVLMYTTPFCPYCRRAKYLLDKKGVRYEEIRVDGNRRQLHTMLKLSKRNTVPQIFIDDHHVGGYDDLAELDAFGQLDTLLGLGA